MTSLKPRSIFQLTVIGFLTVVSPLVAALVLAARQADDLGDQSRRAVFEASSAMRASRTVLEQLLAMERNARQFVVLNDQRLLTVFTGRRDTLRDAARELVALKMSDAMTTEVLQVVEGEQAAFNALAGSSRDRDKGRAAVRQYSALVDEASELVHDTNLWIDHQALVLQRQVGDTERLMFMQSLVLVAAALLLAGMFTALITRPLRQLDRAIHQLGNGGICQPVRVQGPTDLQELGARLEWLRNRLSELEQQRIAFLRHVSHELKSPLTAIQEGVALINDRVVGPLTGRQDEIVQILRKQGRRLQRLIEDLLKFNVGRPDVLSPVPCDLRLDTVVDGIVSDHALAAKAACVNVVSHMQPVVVRCDADQARVITDNLLTNAIKYSPPGCQVTLCLARENGNAVLDVTDQGPGIPPKDRARVFEAFYQGPPPARQHVQGTGLGLAIASDFARLNKGRIELLESERGAHFRAWFPLAAGEEA